MYPHRLQLVMDLVLAILIALYGCVVVRADPVDLFVQVQVQDRCPNVDIFLEFHVLERRVRPQHAPVAHGEVFAIDENHHAAGLDVLGIWVRHRLPGRRKKY